MTGKAIEKLKAGEKAFKGDMKAMFMKNAVCEALISFCKQNEEFAVTTFLSHHPHRP